MALLELVVDSIRHAGDSSSPVVAALLRDLVGLAAVVEQDWRMLPELAGKNDAAGRLLAAGIHSHPGQAAVRL